MSEYAVEAKTTAEREVKISVVSDDGTRHLVIGAVTSTQRYESIIPTPTLTLSFHEEVGEDTWRKIREAVDQAFALYKKTFQ